MRHVVTVKAHFVKTSRIDLAEPSSVVPRDPVSRARSARRERSFIAMNGLGGTCAGGLAAERLRCQELEIPPTQDLEGRLLRARNATDLALNRDFCAGLPGAVRVAFSATISRDNRAKRNI